MKICQSCKKEIPVDLFIGRQAQCPVCQSDLHSCLNCTFYEHGVYNDCRERQAERVLDKGRSNFCDYFRYQDNAVKSSPLAGDPTEKLNALFK